MGPIAGLVSASGAEETQSKRAGLRDGPEFGDIVGDAGEAPFVLDFVETVQEELTESARLLDLSENRLGQLSA